MADPRFPEQGVPSASEQQDVFDAEQHQGFIDTQLDVLENSFGGMGLRRIQDEFQPNYDYLSQDDEDISTTDQIMYGTAAVVRSVLGMTSQGVTYDKEAEAPKLLDGIPYNYHDNIMDYDDLDAAYRARQRILDGMERDQRLAAQGAHLTPALLLDLDTPLMFVSGGTWAGIKTASLAAKQATKVGVSVERAAQIGHIVSHTTAGVSANALMSAGGMAWDERFGWAEAAQATLLGGVAGGAFGGLAPQSDDVVKALTKARTDLEDRVIRQDESLYATVEGKVDPIETPVEEANRLADEAASVEQPLTAAKSIGAAETNPGSNVPDPELDLSLDPSGNVSDTTKAWTRTHERWRNDSGWQAQKEEALEESIIGGFSKLEDAVDAKTGGSGSNWLQLAMGNAFAHKIWKTKAPSANWLSGNIFESSNGLGRTNTSAAVMAEIYENRGNAPLIEYNKARQEWAKANNNTIAFGYGITPSGERAFDRAVRLEINAREYGRPGTTDPAVRRAADQAEETLKRHKDQAIGRDGERSVDGWDEIGRKDHYQPYTWNGKNITEILKSGRLAATVKESREIIIDAMAEGYRRAGMGSQKDARVVARALVARAQARDASVDTSLNTLLTKDGQEFLNETLEMNGTPQVEREAIMKRLVGDRAERSRMGEVKKRNDIDLEATIPTLDGSDLRIVDLMNDSFLEDVHRYGRKTSRAAALARQGITNVAMRKEINTAIQTQQRALGEVPIAGQELDAMWSHFDGGAIKGWDGRGTDPAVQAPTAALIRKGASAAFLGKVGLTQLGETGAIIAAHGVKNFLHRSGIQDFIQEGARANRKQLLEEVGVLTGPIGHDPLLSGNKFSLDDTPVADQWDIVNAGNKWLNVANHAQGYMSGLFQVMAAQQKMASIGMLDVLFQKLRKAGLDEANNFRLSEADRFRAMNDLGLDEPTLDRLTALIDNGTIEFGEEGFLTKINSHLWEPDLQDIMGVAIKRRQAQLVQKPFAGEQDPWMHSSLGAIMTQFKTFPMLAAQKQGFRNLRAADQEAASMVLYSLATAGAAVMLRDVISGKESDIEDVARRAVQYSNMTGWFTMYSDTVMGILGINSMQVDPYASRKDLVPPSLQWANSAMRLPGAVLDVATGNIDGSTRDAFKALPFRNVVIWSQIMDDLAPTAKERKAREARRAERDAARALQEAQVVEEPVEESDPADLVLK